MGKMLQAFVIAALLSGPAHALPNPLAMGSLFAKLFKGGAAAKEAVVAGRSAEAAVAAKGLEHLTAGDAARAGPVLQVVEPKPYIAADVMAKSRKDADAYKSLRDSAEKGDASAMLEMSDMTASGKVLDSGEPWRGYWLFQAARLGNLAAMRKSRNECESGDGRRMTDRYFDSACGRADKRSLYNGDKFPEAYSAYRNDLILKPAVQQGEKR